MASLRSTPEEQERKRKEKENENRYLRDPQEGLKLLARLLVKPKPAVDSANIKLEELRKLIAEKFNELCNQDDLPNEAEMHRKLADALEDLTELVSFPALANKTVVGIGGSFSAGKSKFINSLMGVELLPTAIDPTTAIPTYLAQGESEDIKAINLFGHPVPVEQEAIKALCHEFNQKHQVQTTSFISSLHITTPKFPYRHLAFVDTPGYSKPDTAEISTSDREIALKQLRQAEVLIWLMDCSRGTLIQTDIEFIRDVREREDMITSQPVFVVLNKADQVGADAIQKVMEEVKNKLVNAGIPYSGIVAYNSLDRCPLACDGEGIAEYLGNASKMLKPCRLPDDFSKVFETYTKFNLQQKNQLGETLRFFNEFKVRMDSNDSLTALEKKQLDGFISDLKKRILPLSGLVAGFEKTGEQVLKLVQEILDEIKVEDELPEQLELIGDVRVRNKAILDELTKGQELSGTVTNILPAVGAFIECGLGETVLLTASDIISYGNQSDLNMWHVHGPIRTGSACTVRIQKVSRRNGDVEVSVMFGGGKEL